MRDGMRRLGTHEVQQLEEEQAAAGCGGVAAGTAAPPKTPRTSRNPAVSKWSARTPHAPRPKSRSRCRTEDPASTISCRASEYRYARYVEDWRARVEKIGNQNYPDDARGRYYGALRMTVAIRKDGSVADTLVDHSSGSPVLDRAARRIVQLAAPYPPFPPEIARDTDILEITRTWIFTNDQLATRSTQASRP
jgi:TonB family protein